MSKKNIFLLAAWYIAGGIISSLYNKKRPEELKKDLEKSRKKWEWDFSVMLENFIETQWNLLEDLKSHVMTKKNKKLFNEKKAELLKLVDIYKKEWLGLVEELKVKWKDYLEEASDNLEKLYEEKKDEIDSLKEVAPSKAKELKANLKQTFEEIKKKVK